MSIKLGGGKIKNSVGAFAAAVAIGLAGMTASAQTETFNGNIDASVLSGAIATTLPDFNSSLGTLTGVQITLDFLVTPVATLYNFTGNTATFTPSDFVFASIPGSPATPWTISLGTDSWSLTPPTVSTGDIAGTGQIMANGGSLTFVGGTSVSADLTDETGLDFSAYTGPGDLSFGSSGTVAGGSSGNGFFGGGNADLAGTATVTYDFTPVPEPGTLALAGLGGLSLLLCRRQRK